MEEKSYKDLEDLQQDKKENILKTFSNEIIFQVKNISYGKLLRIIECIPKTCKLHYVSLENKRRKFGSINKLHPVRPSRNEIYNADITENVGSELSGNHLVIIVQNYKGNQFGEKVNVLPIEGDGRTINPNYQIELLNNDLEFGELDKNPSRIIITDITTIDKARLGLKIGKIKSEKMKLIDTMLRNQLNL